VRSVSRGGLRFVTLRQQFNSSSLTPLAKAFPDAGQLGENIAFRAVG